MDYSLNPSLGHFSVAQIALELWQTKDLREELASFVLSYDKKKIINFYDRKVRANKILGEVTRKATNLPLPQCLKTLVTNYLGLVGNQISKTYSRFFPASSGTKPNFDFYLTHLRWTPFGTVDKHETVESFRNEKCIPAIAIPSGCIRDTFSDKTSRVELIAQSKLLLNDRYLDFTLNFLSAAENNSKLVFSDRYLCCTEIILSTIKEMNSTQRSKFIQLNWAFVMNILLNDPLRWPQFLESVELMKHCIPFEFDRIMAKTAEKGNEDFAHFNDCRNLFQETWIRSPVDSRTFGVSVIRSLVASEDADSIKLMFDDVYDETDYWWLKERRIGCILNAFLNTPLYVQKGDFGYITRFLEKVLEVPEEASADYIADIQWRILIGRKFYFCAKFLSEGKFETVDKFVNWGVGCSRDPSDFKRELAYVKGLEICRSWIVSGDYFAIDEFVNWCFTSEKEKTEFKMSILQPEVVTSLESGDTEMADIFYNWFLKKSLECGNGNHSFQTVNFAGGYDDLNE